MNKLLVAVALLVVATSADLAPGFARTAADVFASGRRFPAGVTLVNAPGGAYIQCDPRDPSSPIRCTPDGW
jgi:hypothetical protein